MKTEYRYRLEKGSKKHHCPDCDKKTFVFYIDMETGDYLPQHYGRCDRENKCSYHLNPYVEGYAKAIKEQEQGSHSEFPNNWKPQRKKSIPQPRPKPVFFDFDTFKQTLAPERYEKNTFIQNLLYRAQYPFELEEVTKAMKLYQLGTIVNGYRSGAITFPFIDVNNNVRVVQVKQFDKANHTTGTDFLHSIIEKHHTKNNKPLPKWLKAYNKNETKVSCLFGEHLLSKHPCNPVALVEAPKTAVYGMLYFGSPEQPTNLLWLAVYNLSSLKLHKCKVLKGRDVYLFPDLSKDGKAFKLWSNKANEMQRHLQGTYFTVSDLLEQSAPEQDKEQGKDIADYLIKQDWREFRKRNIIEQPPQSESEISRASEQIEAPKTKIFSHATPMPKVEAFNPVRIEQPKKEKEQNWTNDIEELEAYFGSIEIPKYPIKLNKYSTIINCPLYIKSHIKFVKANNGNKAYLPYLNRLQKLKQVLTMRFT